MPINIDFPEEGDAFTAARLNAALNEVEDTLNALASEDVARGALRRDHLPSPVETEWTDGTPRGGLQAQGPDDPDEEMYFSELASSGTPPTANWDTFSSTTTSGSGGAAAPYGPRTSATVAEGWRIPAHDGDISLAAELRLENGWRPDNTLVDYKVAGLLVHFSCNLCVKDDTSSQQDPTNENHRGGLFLAVGVEVDDNNSITRHIIRSSVRFFHAENHARGNIGTFAVVTKDDLPQGGLVTAVFGAVLSQDVTNTTALGFRTRIDYYDLNYIPLIGEKA